MFKRVLTTIAAAVIGLSAITATTAPASAAEPGGEESGPGAIYGTVSLATPPNGTSTTIAYHLIVDIWNANPDPTTGGTSGHFYLQDNYFSLGGLVPGDYFVKARYFDPFHPSSNVYADTYYGDAFTEASATKVHVAPGSSVDASLTMQVGARLSGKVTAADTGKGLWDAWVELYDANGEREGVSTWTDRSGNFDIPGITPGTHYIHYSAAQVSPRGRYADQWWDGGAQIENRTATALGPSTTTNVSQALPRGSTIAGRMTDTKGKPLNGSVVLYRALGSEDDYSSYVGEVPVDEKGAYAFRGLAVGDYKVGFTTVLTPAPSPSLARAAVLAYNGGPVTETGSLAPSYPYIPAWYSGATTFAAANSVSVSSAGQSVTGISAKLKYDPTFQQSWPGEKTGGQNKSEKPCQCSSGDPVNNATGEYYSDDTDLSMSGTGPAFEITRAYTTSAAVAGTDGPFGYGSSSSTSMHLSIAATDNTSGDPTVVDVTQENGAVVRFVRDVNGLYVAPPRAQATLERSWWNGSWIFTRAAKTSYSFDSTGKITSAADLDGNQITYSYSSGQLSSMYGSGGREFDFTWTGSHITSIADSAGRTVQYEYDADGNLSASIAVDGARTDFTSDSAHRITRVATARGIVLDNTYDAFGRVQAQSDGLGRVTGFDYSVDGATQTTTITSANGARTMETYLDGSLQSREVASGTNLAATTKFEYDDALNLTKRTDPLGRVMTMKYDDRGNETSERDPLGHTTTWTYDQLNDVTSRTDPAGATTQSTFDQSGHKTSQSTAEGNTSTWTYNADGTPATTTDPLGNVTTYGYDNSGRMTTLIDPAGRTTTSSYDLVGHLTAQVAPGGATTTYTNDAAGRTMTKTDPLGRVETFEYDSSGNLTKDTDASHHVTRNSYDLANQKTKTIDPAGATVRYGYDAVGNQTYIKDADGNITRTLYNLRGDKTVDIDANGNRTTTSYTRAGVPVTITYADGSESRQVFDRANRLTGITDPDGGTLTYGYDDAGHRTTATDQLGRITSYTYDKDGLVLGQMQPDGSADHRTYDAAGRLIKFVDSDGNITRTGFDAAGNKVSTTAPGGAITRYRYNDAGLLSKVIEPDGTSLAYAYDKAARPVRVTPSEQGTLATTYRYDAVGHRIAMTDDTGTTTTTYDAAGRVIATTNGAGGQVAWTRDQAGRATSMTYPGGTSVAYTFDPAGNITSVTDWNGQKTSFGWSATQRMTSVSYPNGVTQTRSYDHRGDLLTDTDTSATGTVADRDYTYDAAGQLVSQNNTASGLTPTAYTYDPNRRLSGLNGDQGTTSSSAGQLSTMNGTALTYNTAQQLTSAVTSTGSSTFGYDADGQRTSASDASGQTTMTYSARGSLTGVSRSDEAAITYGVNGDGLRMSRTQADHTEQWTWNTAGDLPLLLSDGTRAYIYGPGITPIAQIDLSSGATQYLHSDNVGSVDALTDSSGQTVGRYSYDVYGSPTHSGDAESVFGFSGNITDSRTGLLYLRARDYDPATGQFLTIDPAVGVTHQPYAYADGDPLTNTDPSGLCPKGLAPQAKPTSFGYSYDFDFDLGLGDDYSVDYVAKIFKENPTKIFPFPVTGCTKFTQCAVCHLKALDDLPFSEGDVQVTVNKTTVRFTVVSLGYFDYPGSTITFQIVQGNDGPHLQQHARAIASAAPGWMAAIGAHEQWTEQAYNLAVQVRKSDH